MNEEPLLVEQRDHVLLLTINRPQARNSVDLRTAEMMADAAERAEADPSVYVVVVTGAGDVAFCAGADLKALSRGDRLLPEGREHWSFAGFVNHFISKPTIAAVNGFAYGGGAELALACDLIVASDTASFALPEVKRGLIAAAGGAFRLLGQLPQRVAMELILTGDPLTAAQALGLGLINRAVPPPDVLPAAFALAERIAQNAPLAVQASKRVAYGVRAGSPSLMRAGESDRWDLTLEEIDRLIGTEDAIEGPRAFAEKREPVWKAR